MTLQHSDDKNERKESTATTTLSLKIMKSLTNFNRKETNKFESDSEPESKSESEIKSEFEAVVKK